MNIDSGKLYTPEEVEKMTPEERAKLKWISRDEYAHLAHMPEESRRQELVRLRSQQKDDRKQQRKRIKKARKRNRK